MTPDPELLRQYCDAGSQDAFTEVVRRYVDLVFSASSRFTLHSSFLILIRLRSPTKHL